MKTILKKILYPVAGRYIRAFQEEKQISQWKNAGSPVPPIHIVKQREIKKYTGIYNIKTLVETGTYQGNMVEAMKNNFDAIFSIELDEDLQEKAKKKFSAYNHIRILKGDSSEVIGNLLTNVIKERCLFWLDGHYSGGVTAKGALNTPVLQELIHIKNHIIKNHIILIDDLHCFDGTNDYPTLEALKKFAQENFPRHNIQTAYNIIYLLPN
ncbi:hypothetical protein Q0590_21395 [Rhodocytophaga aerolata]|uniref:Class I SAM-dependent methyltransferase n=1 Tax=Rhodocytophaga aerolata TaxID=455078 RepID=A0ABT8R9S1_9BACT|nr:hypothetical protein [Rhodocytophaga aerolata]MDO1448847.1 hypothetical protein [Rhodocytophaga aerolata]